MSQARSLPQARSTSTARLASGARATLELVGAAMAGEGHLDAAERQGAPRSRPIEISLRRLPAILVVLLLAGVVLAGIAVLSVLAMVVRAVAAASAALAARHTLIALR